MPYIVVLARRVGAETRLQEINRCISLMYEISWCYEHWSHGVYVMNSEVSTSGVCSDEVSSLSHIWFCDIASPIPSWHRLRRGGV